MVAKVSQSRLLMVYLRFFASLPFLIKSRSRSRSHLRFFSISGPMLTSQVQSCMQDRRLTPDLGGGRSYLDCGGACNISMMVIGEW